MQRWKDLFLLSGCMWLVGRNMWKQLRYHSMTVVRISKWTYSSRGSRGEARGNQETGGWPQSEIERMSGTWPGGQASERHFSEQVSHGAGSALCAGKTVRTGPSEASLWVGARLWRPRRLCTGTFIFLITMLRVLKRFWTRKWYCHIACWKNHFEGSRRETKCSKEAMIISVRSDGLLN